MPVVACFGSITTDINGSFFHLHPASVQDRVINSDNIKQAVAPGKEDPFITSAKSFLSNYSVLRQLTSCEKSIL